MYKVIKIDKNGTEKIIGTTSINIADIDVVYDVLEGKATKTLDKYIVNGSMKSEDKANVISNVMINLLNQSIQIENIKKDGEIKQTQIELAKSKKSFILENMKIANNIQEQKYITEQIKNGKISFTYVYYKNYYDKDNNIVQTENFTDDNITIGEDTFILFNDFKRIKSKILNEGDSISIAELAKIKTIEETAYIINQSNQLTASVGFNNQLKIVDSLSNMYGYMSSGGMVVPQAGWDYIFGITTNLTTVSSDVLQEFASKIGKLD